MRAECAESRVRAQPGHSLDTYVDTSRVETPRGTGDSIRLTEHVETYLTGGCGGRSQVHGRISRVIPVRDSTAARLRGALPRSFRRRVVNR